MIQITNTGGDVRAVLTGDPESPDNVKLLQPGESCALDDANITINDGANVKDRRSSDQQPYGRRTGDPRVDQRQVNRDSRQRSSSSASAAGRAGSQYSGGHVVDVNEPNRAGVANNNTQAGATTGNQSSVLNVNDPAARGPAGTSATNPNTSDGTNVPKNSSGEQIT